jgi:hypothetical protein
MFYNSIDPIVLEIKGIYLYEIHGYLIEGRQERRFKEKIFYKVQ